MNRISALIRRAAEVRRTIFASLPGSVRFAYVWGTLVAGDEAMFDAWGKALGAVFLQAGVPEMPDPGEGWEKHPGDARRLPHGYMADFIASVYRTILSQSARDPSVPEEAIARFFRKLQTGQAKIDLTKLTEGFKTAKTWAFTGMVNEGRSIRKRKLVEFARQEDVQHDDEGHELERDLSDPNALDTFKKIEHNPAVWKAYLDFLAHHMGQTVPQYMTLLNEGYMINEIIGGPKAGLNPDGTLRYPGMLDNYTPGPTDPTNWREKYKRKIVRVTEEFLKSKGLSLEDLVPP